MDENVNNPVVPDTSKNLADNGNDSEQNNANSQESKTVTRDAYERLLNQRKKDQSRLKELEAKEQERQEQEQLKRGEYEKVMQLKEERIKTLQSEIESRNAQEQEGKKIMAFMDKLGADISEKDYLSLVDIDSILVDPESGQVDQLSLEKEVNRFSQKYWKVIDRKEKKSPQSVGHMGGTPNMKRDLKSMTREELRQNYIRGNFTK